MGDLDLLFVILFVHGMYVSAQSSAVCGELHTSYSYSGTTIICHIRLIPSIYMSPYIRKNMYRWYHSRIGLGQVVIINNKETNFTLNTHKYSESNFTLHIYGFTREDEGTYVVECRKTVYDEYIGRDSVYISLPENKPSETTTVPLKTTIPQLNNSTHLYKDTTNNGTKGLSVIVVALCVVVVVIVVAMTVIWAKRNQMAIKENKKQVNNDEISVRYIQGEAVDEPVYNEIDIDTASIMSEVHYAEMHVQHDANLHQNLLSSDISPRLPVMPNNGECNEDYAYICREGNTQANPNYAILTVWHKSQNNRAAADEEAPDRAYYILEPNNDVATD